MEHIKLDWKLVESNELKILEKYTKLAYFFIIFVNGRKIRNKIISVIFILHIFKLYYSLYLKKMIFYNYCYLQFLSLSVSLFLLLLNVYPLFLMQWYR